jgi:hypothetical protein
MLESKSCLGDISIARLSFTGTFKSSFSQTGSWTIEVSHISSVVRLPTVHCRDRERRGKYIIRSLADIMLKLKLPEENGGDG